MTTLLVVLQIQLRQDRHAFNVMVLDARVG